MVLLLVYVGVMFVWSRAEARRNTCQGIEVVIDGKAQVGSISEKSVLEVLQGYEGQIKGAPLYMLNTLDIAEYLRKFNNFENVDCVLTSQGYLKVRVTPMMPALRVFDGQKGYYVNKDGKTMAALPGFHVDVPIVYGNFNKNFRPEALLPLVNFVESDSLMHSLTSMIVAKDPSNIIIVPRIKGHVINIGNTSRLQEKRDAIYTAYKTIMPYRGWETYDTISVKYKGQIIATRRDKTPLYPNIEILEEGDLEEDALQAASITENKESENPTPKQE